jgi:hypothetical protein
VQSTDIAITFNEYSTWNRKMTTFVSRHYPQKSSSLDIGVFGHTALSPEVGHIPPGAHCITQSLISSDPRCW